MEVPVVFICRNNGWAISTPITEQFRSNSRPLLISFYTFNRIKMAFKICFCNYYVVRGNQASIWKWEGMLCNYHELTMRS